MISQFGFETSSSQIEQVDPAIKQLWGHYTTSSNSQQIWVIRAPALLCLHDVATGSCAELVVSASGVVECPQYQMSVVSVTQFAAEITWNNTDVFSSPAVCNLSKVVGTEVPSAVPSAVSSAVPSVPIVMTTTPIQRSTVIPVLISTSAPIKVITTPKSTSNPPSVPTPTTPRTPYNTQFSVPESDKNTLSPAAISGIVVGVLLVAGAIFILLMKSGNSQQNFSNTFSEELSESPALPAYHLSSI